MLSTRVVRAAIAVAACLAAAGCGAGVSASAGRTPTTGQVSHSVTTVRPASSARDAVGAGCDRIPATGPGSIAAMATEPVVTAAAHSRMLAEITRSIRTAGLTSDLNSAKAITVFAPDDSAFAALGHGNLTTLLADKADLTKMLKYHVVSGRHTPADLASGKRLTTLLGTVIVPKKSRGKYRVNNAQVVCGNIQTANATIYIVNKVLVPIP